MYHTQKNFIASAGSNIFSPLLGNMLTQPSLLLHPRPVIRKEAISPYEEQVKKRKRQKKSAKKQENGDEDDDEEEGERECRCLMLYRVKNAATSAIQLQYPGRKEEVPSVRKQLT